MKRLQPALVRRLPVPRGQVVVVLRRHLSALLELIGEIDHPRPGPLHPLHLIQEAPPEVPAGDHLRTRKRKQYYSHNGPIRHRKRGYILMMDQYELSPLERGSKELGKAVRKEEGSLGC
eukprot:1179117-Prorocentrum_minimum.AAC.1